jgi:hypothetical protein
MLAQLLCVLACGEAIGADLGCKKNPNLTGACYRLNGTIMESADVGWVLHVPGRPNEHYVVRPAPESNRLLPNSLSRFEERIPPESLGGAFVVCPIPEQFNQFDPGFLKFVCIESGSNIVVRLPYK